MMCAEQDALRERRQAAELLGQACLAKIASPIGEALDRAYNLDPIIPDDELALIDQIIAASGRAGAH